MAASTSTAAANDKQRATTPPKSSLIAPPQVPLPQSGPIVPIPPKPAKSVVLVRIYRFLTALCGFMVVWILIYPSSVLMEHSLFHRTSFLALNNTGRKVVSPDLVMKYQGEYLVQALHILPGALWAILAPVQMHSQIRKHYRRSHTVLGYVFAVTSVLIGLGVVVIQHSGLSYENFFSDLDPWPVSTGHGLHLLTLYFVGCMALSLFYAVVRKDFHLHRQWMVRHVASGIWISLQRVILVLLSAVPSPVSYTREQQRLVFPISGIVALIVTMGTGEFAVHLLNQQQAAKLRRKMAKSKTN